ncbi:hypothetical protein [Moraxella sp.]|uniref:hypothetical protein n=1 Tax=Moraxella sp. TaxID=479 RepID=UPI0026DD1374|nr:hypothetical protein [Moraxella sp.]MDO4895657.1 hypothetical protein [Moraxella sp.]
MLQIKKPPKPKPKRFKKVEIKIIKKPKTKAQIQADSDAKRGVKVASYKFPVEFIDELTVLSEKTGMSRSAIIMQAVELWSSRLDAV